MLTAPLGSSAGSSAAATPTPPSTPGLSAEAIQRAMAMLQQPVGQNPTGRIEIYTKTVVWVGVDATGTF